MSPRFLEPIFDIPQGCVPAVICKNDIKNINKSVKEANGSDRLHHFCPSPCIFRLSDKQSKANLKELRVIISGSHNLQLMKSKKEDRIHGMLEFQCQGEKSNSGEFFSSLEEVVTE